MTSNYNPELEESLLEDSDKPIQERIEEYEKQLKSEAGSDEEEIEEVVEEQEESQEKVAEAKSKYLGLFDDEAEAIDVFRHLSEKAVKADTIERQAVEAQRKDQAATQLDEFNRQATQHWKELVAAGKGDEAFLFMQDHVLRQSAMIADMMINDKLSAISEFERGKQLFLQDPAVADVHENVNQIEALLRMGWTEKDAVSFVRSLKGHPAKQLDGDKVKEAKKKTRDQSYMDESTSGKSRASSGKKASDRFADDVLDFLGI